MKVRTIAWTVVAMCFVSLCFAGENPNLGTWKLNEAKSKIGPEAPKNYTVVYTAVGDSVKVTVDGVDGQGKPAHNEWTGKFDGKDYPVTGDPNSDARSYKKIDDHNMDLSVKKDGKVTMSAHITIAADGKSRTVNGSTIDSGKKREVTTVYDKQ